MHLKEKFTNGERTEKTVERTGIEARLSEYSLFCRFDFET